MKKYVWGLLTSLFLIGCSSDDSDTTNLTCENPIITITSDDFTSAFVAWTQEEASSITLEYGEAGFSQGSGSEVTSSQSVEINNLAAGTDYDVYVKANCGNGGVSMVSGPFGFSTLECIPASGGTISSLTDTDVVINYVSGAAESYQAEFGPAGFAVGSGTVVTIDPGQFTLTGLVADTAYEAYVITDCGGSSTPIYTSPIAFTTDTSCRTPRFFDIGFVESEFASLFWDSEETAFEIEYGLVGFTLGTGTVLGTSETFVDVTGLTPATTYEFYVRANCGSQGFSNDVGPLVVTTNP
ncbi:MAG: fibronectin type III domain-containing protein [Flavobacteriaceae bacterium]|nr:fibronectin type III domain-containing protein [Flavobacteriaceae bacterium]